MIKIFDREPAAILAALQSILALAVGFGLKLTAAQVTLILAASAAVLGLVTRQVVTSPATAAKLKATNVMLPAASREQPDDDHTPPPQAA